MKPVDVKISGSSSRDQQEIRINVLGGGPSGMEIVFTCDKSGTRIHVWNPFKHPATTHSAWATVPGVHAELTPQQAETLNCELICPVCGCKEVQWHSSIDEYQCRGCLKYFKSSEIQEGHSGAHSS